MLKNRTKQQIASLLFSSLLIVFTLVINSCKQEKSKDIVIWQLTDPIKLNPMTATDGSSNRMIDRIFQSLIQIDYSTYELIPVLVKSHATIEEIDGETMALHFEIREEAVWDDTGEPITGDDVDFSLRLMKTPGAAIAPRQVYFKYIKDVKVDTTNKKKFTLICERYMIMESTLTNLMIMPKHIYDPENVLENFTVKNLTENATELAKNKEIQRYAQFFTGIDFQKNTVVGSGPYVLESWEDQQKVTLRLKDNWWANNVEGGNGWLQAHPKKLIYKTISEMNTAVTALRNEEIDVMSRIDPCKFVDELQKDSSFINTFHHGTPSQFVYSYLGMKMDNSKLSDVKTRKALRHLMNPNEYSERIFCGLGERVSTFIHPIKKEFINKKLILPDFNIEKAKTFLVEAGWSDSNQDGTLDKIIDGKRVDFKIEVLYPKVSNTSEEGVLLFKDYCESAGIKIIPIGLDFRVFIEKLQAGNFEMYFGLWQSGVLESDPTQIWHTDAIGNGGQNYPGFGDAKSDAVLEKLVKEVSKEKRVVLYKELQQIIDDEAPYIFLLSVKNRVAVNKRIIDPNFSSMGDGYWDPGFILVD